MITPYNVVYQSSSKQYIMLIKKEWFPLQKLCRFLKIFTDPVSQIL